MSCERCLHLWDEGSKLNAQLAAVTAERDALKQDNDGLSENLRISNKAAVEAEKLLELASREFRRMGAESGDMFYDEWLDEYEQIRAARGEAG